MNGSKVKELKDKIFGKMFGTGYSASDKKALMESDNFKAAYKLAKKKYAQAKRTS